MAQGREEARRFLKEHKDIAQQIEEVIRSAAKPSPFGVEKGEGHDISEPESELVTGNNHQDNLGWVYEHLTA